MGRNFLDKFLEVPNFGFLAVVKNMFPKTGEDWGKKKEKGMVGEALQTQKNLQATRPGINPEALSKCGWCFPTNQPGQEISPPRLTIFFHSASTLQPLASSKAKWRFRLAQWTSHGHYCASQTYGILWCKWLERFSGRFQVRSPTISGISHCWPM